MYNGLVTKTENPYITCSIFSVGFTNSRTLTYFAFYFICLKWKKSKMFVFAYFQWMWYLISPENQLHSSKCITQKTHPHPHPHNFDTAYNLFMTILEVTSNAKLQSEKVSIAIEKLTTWHTTNTWENSSNNTERRHRSALTFNNMNYFEELSSDFR